MSKPTHTGLGWVNKTVSSMLSPMTESSLFMIVIGQWNRNIVYDKLFITIGLLLILALIPPNLQSIILIVSDLRAKLSLMHSQRTLVLGLHASNLGHHYPIKPLVSFPLLFPFPTSPVLSWTSTPSPRHTHTHLIMLFIRLSSADPDKVQNVCPTNDPYSHNYWC